MYFVVFVVLLVFLDVEASVDQTTKVSDDPTMLEEGW